MRKCIPIWQNNIQQFLQNSRINTFNTYNTNSFSTLISSGNIDLFEKQQRNPIMELNKLQNQEKEISKFNNEVLFTVLENTAMKYPSKDNSYNIEILDELWRQSNNEDLPKDLIHFLGQLEFTLSRYIDLTEEVLQQTKLVLKELENE